MALVVSERERAQKEAEDKARKDKAEKDAKDAKEKAEKDDKDAKNGKKADKDAKEGEPKPSVPEEAWNATKNPEDPEWKEIPNVEFKGKLEFAADKVKSTGIAQTNFELKCKQLFAEELENALNDGSMAVVNPHAGLGGAPAVELTEAEQEMLDKAEKASEENAKEKEKADKAREKALAG